MNYSYKKALRIAAEQAYEEEVVSTGMEPLIVGEDNDFANKKEWVDARIDEWLEMAMSENKAA